MNFSTQFASIENSIVRILAITGQGQQQQIRAVGSGVIIGVGTKVLSCSHCILQNTQTAVLVNGQGNAQTATIIFNDPVLDIGVLEFRNSIGVGVTLGDSTLVRIGHEAFVAGFPSSSSTITALFAHIAGFYTHNNNLNWRKCSALAGHL